MKKPVDPKLEAGRSPGPWPHSAGDTFGRFIVESESVQGSLLNVILSDGDTESWLSSGLPLPAFEHASVTVWGRKRCPTWEEMCQIKELIWNPDEWVIQYHPAKAENISHHPFCLHLWKPVGLELPKPPGITIAPRYYRD